MSRLMGGKEQLGDEGGQEGWEGGMREGEIERALERRQEEGTNYSSVYSVTSRNLTKFSILKGARRIFFFKNLIYTGATTQKHQNLTNRHFATFSERGEERNPRGTIPPTSKQRSHNDSGDVCMDLLPCPCQKQQQRIS